MEGAIMLMHRTILLGVGQVWPKLRSSLIFRTNRSHLWIGPMRLAWLAGKRPARALNNLSQKTFVTTRQRPSNRDNKEAIEWPVGHKVARLPRERSEQEGVCSVEWNALITEIPWSYNRGCPWLCIYKWKEFPLFFSEICGMACLQ